MWGEEAVRWINEDSILECYKVFSDNDIAMRVACGLIETGNFEEYPESDEEIHKKLSHIYALACTEVFINYLKKEDESISAEKFILRNLHGKIYQRGSEKRKKFYHFILHKLGLGGKLDLYLFILYKL